MPEMIVGSRTRHEVQIEELALVWLERDEVARLLVNENLTVLWGNAAALDSLSGEGDLELRDGVLIPRNRALHASLLAFIRGCGDELATLCLPCEDRDGHLLFRARHVAVEQEERLFGLSFHRSGSRFIARYPDIRSAFKLTPSEERVLSKMVDGLTADEISADAQLSIETIRTHIRNIYTKLGVVSREGLFARLRAYQL